MDKKVAIIILAVVVVVLGVAAFFIFSGSSLSDPTKTKAELVFWNLNDDKEIFKPLIAEFNKTYPGIKITYLKKTTETSEGKMVYESELLDAMAAGRGPDIFAIGNAWLPRYMDKISPMPASNEFMTTKEYRDTFVDVAGRDFIASPFPLSANDTTVYSEQIYAVPLFVDTLALYWNKDIFYSANIAEPPKDWNEFVDLVSKKLVQKDENGINRAGASLGTADNINRSVDILGLLMLQTGTRMVDDKKQKATFNQSVLDQSGAVRYVGQDALRFYTSFASPTNNYYTWNEKMPYSIDAFAQGKSAMMINYAYNINVIEGKDSRLNFGIAPIPQPSDSKTLVSYANYWGLTVAKSADQNKAYAAWLFISWLAQNDKQYIDIAKRPTSRLDLVKEQANDSKLGVFAQQALSAKSWYRVDSSATEGIFSDMIKAVNKGELDVSKAIDRATKQITLLMEQFNVKNGLSY